jgi:hypothetical protein
MQPDAWTAAQGCLVQLHCHQQCILAAAAHSVQLAVSILATSALHLASHALLWLLLSLPLPLCPLLLLLLLLLPPNHSITFVGIIYTFMFLLLLPLFCVTAAAIASSHQQHHLCGHHIHAQVAAAAAAPTYITLLLLLLLLLSLYHDSITFVGIIYTLMSLCLVMMVPYDQLDPAASFATAFTQVGLPWAQYLVALGAVLGIVTGVLVRHQTCSVICVCFAAAHRFVKPGHAESDKCQGW